MGQGATDLASGSRFYGDLAVWWPLISPVDEYAEEAEYVATLLLAAAAPVHTVLELGSGGGHNAFHLRRSFEMTLVDLSNEMLDVSRQINPDCRHLQGDMRSVRLNGTFDAVFVHDAVDYMISEDDLRAAMTTAFVHCRPGGTAVFVPDHTREIFQPTSDHGGTDADDGRGVRFMEWTCDPDPNDTWVTAEYAFLLRATDGSVRSVHETHRLGLFDRATWLRLLSDAGFDAALVHEVTDDERTPRDVFVATRPV
jgi:SAM-dependent methyltransferase